MAGLLCGAEDAHDMRVLQPRHHLDLVAYRLPHLALLVDRVAAERDLLDAHERARADVTRQVAGAEGARANERSAHPVLALDVALRCVVQAVARLQTMMTNNIQKRRMVKDLFRRQYFLDYQTTE